MAPPIKLVFKDETNTFTLTRLTREKLYGRRRTIIVDAMGQACERGALTDDGELLLGPGDTAQIYIDAAQNSHERKALSVVDDDGEPLPMIQSTLGREMPLHGPVPVERVLDHATTSVYVLDPEELSPSLHEALSNGEIYETAFTYRASAQTQPMFILKNEGGVFGLLCEAHDFDFVAPDDALSDDDVEDLLSDLLDDFIADGG